VALAWQLRGTNAEFSNRDYRNGNDAAMAMNPADLRATIAAAPQARTFDDEDVIERTGQSARESLCATTQPVEPEAAARRISWHD
jgi:hypothetical protein